MLRYGDFWNKGWAYFSFPVLPNHLNDRAPGEDQETGLGPLHSPLAFRARPCTFSSPEQHKWLPPQWAQRWKCHYIEREIRRRQRPSREQKKTSERWHSIHETKYRSQFLKGGGNIQRTNWSSWILEIW